MKRIFSFRFCFEKIIYVIIRNQHVGDDINLSRRVQSVFCRNIKTISFVEKKKSGDSNKLKYI